MKVCREAGSVLWLRPSNRQKLSLECKFASCKMRAHELFSNCAHFSLAVYGEFGVIPFGDKLEKKGTELGNIKKRSQKQSNRISSFCNETVKTVEEEGNKLENRAVLMTARRSLRHMLKWQAHVFMIKAKVL